MGKTALDVVPTISVVVLRGRGFDSARKAGRDGLGQSLDLSLQIIVRHDKRANRRACVAAASLNGSINRSVERKRAFGDASHDRTSTFWLTLSIAPSTTVSRFRTVHP